MLADIDAARRVAARALAEYGLGGDDALTFVKYRENHVFRVDSTAGGSHALRIHRAGYRTDDEIREELTLLAALAAEGFAVPRVRPTTTGALFCRVADEQGDTHQVDILEWVADAEPMGDVGAAFLGDADIDPATFTSLGALIADLHVTAGRLRRDGVSVRPPWDRDGLVGTRPVWGDPMRAVSGDTTGRDVVRSAMGMVGAALTAYGTGPDRYGPIHADCTPENILVHDGRMTVIDFDDSGDGYYLFDLATAAFFYLPHRRADDVVTALFTGYESVRPLTEEDRLVWRPLLFARGLTYLGWAADRVGDEASDFIFEHVRPLVVALAAEVTASPAPPATGLRTG